MRADLESRKELKETSTGASNECQEIFDHFREHQKRILCLENPQGLQSPNFGKNGICDFITLHSKDSQQIRLPTKFACLSENQLQKGLMEYFYELSQSEKDILLDRFFLTTQSTTKTQMSADEWQGLIAKGCKSFKLGWEAGVFEESYPQEERLSRILDNHFKEKLIERNYHKAIQNTSLMENSLRTSGLKSSQPNWSILRGFSEDSLTRFVGETDESVDSIRCLKDGSADIHKSEKSFESLNEDRTRNGSKRTNVVTPSSPEEVKAYQIQERDRYNNPSSPFLFTIRSGEKRWVAPLSKKNGEVVGRPRDHFLLVSERPNSVTILSLVRDAAAKLPKGYGTRNDICELLKDSQFINRDVDDDRMSSVVSGALDRLHYEKDPCVKYDSNKKLWIYLHVGRQT